MPKRTQAPPPPAIPDTEVDDLPTALREDPVFKAARDSARDDMILRVLEHMALREPPPSLPERVFNVVTEQITKDLTLGVFSIKMTTTIAQLSMGVLLLIGFLGAMDRLFGVNPTTLHSWWVGSSQAAMAHPSPTLPLFSEEAAP